MTAEFGKGFCVHGLRNMQQFYLVFPKRSTLWSVLSWSHYRLLMRVTDENARTFYAEEAAKSRWGAGNYKDKMYGNDYIRQLMNEGDNPPIGLLYILMV